MAFDCERLRPILLHHLIESKIHFGDALQLIANGTEVSVITSSAGAAECFAVG